jgi:hypothetical protein
MRQLLRASCILAIAAAATAGASGARKAVTIGAATGPLRTGIWYHGLESSAANQTEAERIRAAGARIARVYLYWSLVAPTGPEPPAGFQPRDPADPNYHWQSFDTQIQTLSAAGLEPMVQILSAPEWAEGSSSGTYAAGTYKPSPTALADFAAAAAERYSGSFEDRPRVRYWEPWNEPNLNLYLSPQVESGQRLTPGLYRSMLNAAADAIHAVHDDNIVIAGETAPFGDFEPDSSRTPPLYFLERVVCIKKKRVTNKKTHKVTTVYRSACKQRAKFDVWAHHPYTQGGPTLKASLHGNVSLGNLGEMRAVLNAAIRAGHVVSTQRIRFWVTEFSWDSSPPDPKGVPASLEARWVSEALYRVWANGVSLLAWADIRDQPFPISWYQWGLYYADPAGIASDRPKPALRAFRFPFVALPQGKKKTTVYLWGRTPTSKKATVLIERKTRGKWVLVKRLRANGYGIFKARIAKPPKKTTYMRAQLASRRDVSVAFALKAPKKSWTGCIFGTCPHTHG